MGAEEISFSAGFSRGFCEDRVLFLPRASLRAPPRPQNHHKIRPFVRYFLSRTRIGPFAVEGSTTLLFCRISAFPATTSRRAAIRTASISLLHSFSPKCCLATSLGQIVLEAPRSRSDFSSSSSKNAVLFGQPLFAAGSRTILHLLPTIGPSLPPFHATATTATKLFLGHPRRCALPTTSQVGPDLA